MFNDNNYFTLEKPARSYEEIGLDILKSPLRLPRWVISFLLARAITHIAVAPYEVKQQKAIHPIFLTDETDEIPTIIVNLLPKEEYKSAKDLFLKFNNAIMTIPFFSNIKKRQLSKSSEQDKQYIDNILDSIDLLILGESLEKHCQGHQFDWDAIHFKGMECLDEELREYFLQKLTDKYGTEPQKNHKLNLDFFSLETGESAVLDSVAMSKKSGPIDYATEKFIIFCMARNQNYISWMKNFNDCHEFINATIIGFNYRGIDCSKGMTWTQDNMVNDALAQVKRLLELGAKPENIGLEGMCIGGAVATLAAAELHAQGLKVFLYNERSFRSIPRLITGHLLPSENSNWMNPLNLLRFGMVGIIYITVVPFVYLSNWSLDAEEAWEKIPSYYKNYAVIYDPSPQANPSLKSDDLINHSWASMAFFIQKKHGVLAAKRETQLVLTADEKEQIADLPSTHCFKLSGVEHKSDYLHSTQSRFFISASSSDIETKGTMLWHMAKGFDKKLGTSTYDGTSYQAL